MGVLGLGSGGPGLCSPGLWPLAKEQGLLKRAREEEAGTGGAADGAGRRGGVGVILPTQDSFGPPGGSAVVGSGAEGPGLGAGVDWRHVGHLVEVDVVVGEGAAGRGQLQAEGDLVLRRGTGVYT